MRFGIWRCWLVGLAVVLAVGCGSKSFVLEDFVDAGPRRAPMTELCNALDDDLDSRVDEVFRDSVGRYVDDQHCGACNAPCSVDSVERATAIDCGLVADTPRCVATACEPGFVPSITGQCVAAADRLCLACLDDGDCGDFVGARCAAVGGERRCSVGCELGCPDGYRCDAVEDVCVPMGGSCACGEGATFELACVLSDPAGLRCVGKATCTDGALSECDAPDEVCDETDNDCDGLVDEGFRDERGAYILDLRHCGQCGVDCRVSSIPEGDLTCGGDPFAPRCVLECPDALDGIEPGDRIDADLDIANGCECTVSSLDDVPGPVAATGGTLDTNCDGADGVVVESFYVATDGDDRGPGSPTRPLKTLRRAVELASATLATGSPRPHIFVASGDYVETLSLADGLQLHGGYRRDYLALDPGGFRVQVRAPLSTLAPGGAALVAADVGANQTLVEWMTFVGRDATTTSAAAVGAYLRSPGPFLTLRDVEIRAGVAGAGDAGENGRVGAAPSAEPEDGQSPRGAVENAAHACISAGDMNTVRGGRGGSNRCESVDTSGGAGGSARCPEFAEFQASGEPGRGPTSVAAGPGGAGGQDSQGPIMGISCSAFVCCGLADFTVPTDFMGPRPGEPGGDGTSGLSGRGCTEPLGMFDVADRWVGSPATDGLRGTPGAGGGGGGAGGGAVMDWFDGECEFADGLGGGGGGGGAGGCGGGGGDAGSSGGPSIAVLVRYAPGVTPFPLRISNSVLVSSDGGRGGDGGNGGGGALGGTGAFGGDLDRELRSTPTLAGPFAGGRGGPGGRGGSGGGGGGGCGGTSAGVWVAGTFGAEPPGVGALRSMNTFRLGRGGVAGRGGGGSSSAADGAMGGAVDVIAR